MSSAAGDSAVVALGPQIEQEVRLKIDRLLTSAGWVLDPESAERDVFVEDSVKERLPKVAAQQLGRAKPDYTLFHRGRPIAVIEAKKPGVSLSAAILQAQSYAQKIGVDIAFAFNGRKLASLHIPSGEPLLYNDIELSNLPDPDRLAKFHLAKSNKIRSISELVVTSRVQLIELIEVWSDVLRGAGIRSGVERFTEFANLLFLKLLSESEADNGLWHTLVSQDAGRLASFINGFALQELSSKYGSEVVAETNIGDPRALQKIILELNSLSLSSVNEDVKGVAFEHFIQRTTTKNDLGEYFTPRHIVRFMTSLTDPEFGQTVFDPFCGTGGFLVEAYKNLSHKAGRGRHNLEFLQTKSIFGQELTTNARIAKMNMILFGDGHSGVKQRNSITNPPSEVFDIVLSNIPFSQKLSGAEIRAVDPSAKDADEACLLRCFHSLKLGGSMAVVIPEGLVVNNKHRPMWSKLFANSRVRVIASFPRGCFAPYTEAATRMVYLTDKGVRDTSWFHYVTITDDGHTDIKSYGADGGLGGLADGRANGTIDDLQNFLYFYTDSAEPLPVPEGLERSVAVVEINQNGSAFDALRNSIWPAKAGVESVELRQVAYLENGRSITEAQTSDGGVPVIAGGRSSPYTHNKHTHEGNVFTVSKSGAFSGYVWWHSKPIWASDSIVVSSKDEAKFLTAYLYAVVKSRQSEIYSRQQGTGQPHIYKNHIEGIPVPVLSIEAQKELVSDFLKSLAALEAHQEAFNASHTQMLDMASRSSR